MHDAWTKATCVCTFSSVAKHLIDRGRSAGTCTMVHVCMYYRTHMILYAMSTALTRSLAANNVDSTVALFFELHEL